MTLFFARHGESEANILKIFANEPDAPYGLTERGKEQARALADQLANEGLTRAFASPLLRAQQTAKIVTEHLGVPLETRDALREFGVGDHEGSCEQHAWDEYARVESEWLSKGNTRARIGGGECYDDIADRFVPFIQALVQCFGDTEERILLLGHGGTFACMLPLVLANVEPEFAQTHRFRPASFVKANHEDGKLVCERWIDEDLKASGDRFQA